VTRRTLVLLVDSLLSISTHDFDHRAAPYRMAYWMQGYPVSRRTQCSSCDSCRRSRVACDASKTGLRSGDIGGSCSRCALRQQSCTFEVEHNCLGSLARPHFLRCWKADDAFPSSGSRNSHGHVDMSKEHQCSPLPRQEGVVHQANQGSYQGVHIRFFSRTMLTAF